MADDNPVDQVQQLVADARLAFAKDVDALLAEFEGRYAPVATLTRDDWRGLRRRLLEKFDQRVPLRNHADPVLRQLVWDALAILSEDEPRIDTAEWRKLARKALQEDAAV